VTDLERLKREASRNDYRSMARLARALYESGETVRRVLRECYGVEFPEELLAIVDARARRRAPHAQFTNQPWRLAVPLGQGGPAPEPHGLEVIEQRTFAVDPALVPLLVLRNPDSVHGNSLLCYRLDELAAGRSTVIGLRAFWYRDSVAIPEPYGDSLVGVLHEHFAENAHRLERELDSPSNRGAGSIDPTYVSDAQGALARVEDIERQLAAARSPVGS